ncbi:MAG: hypothetical protein R2789_16275 [Microthrixaceae bacterium]
MIIETAGGVAQNVGADILLVLAPERADPYVVDVPPDANQFRRRVEEHPARSYWQWLRFLALSSGSRSPPPHTAASWNAPANSAYDGRSAPNSK